MILSDEEVGRLQHLIDEEAARVGRGPWVLSDEEVGRLQQLIAVGVAAARLDAWQVETEDRAGPGTGGLGHRSGREDPRTRGREQRVRTAGGRAHSMKGGQGRSSGRERGRPERGANARKR